MRFVPYEYQRYCTEYIKTHPIAALFLDMGLGKTVITLSAIKDLMLETFEVSKVLIIAPLRVARDTWPAGEALRRCVCHQRSRPASSGHHHFWESLSGYVHRR